MNDCNDTSNGAPSSGMRRIRGTQSFAEMRWSDGDRNLRLRQHLGSGGMGAVYEGVDSVRGIVAVKRVRLSEQARVECLENEFAVASALRHPQVVRHYELMRARDECWLIMERICGVTLARWLWNRSTRAPTTVLATGLAGRPATPFRGTAEPITRSRLHLPSVYALFFRLAHGIHHLHERGCIHRDLKPDNVVVDGRCGRPVIVDFGIAATREQVASRSYLEGGTIAYLAPELLSAKAQPTAASDWYAFGLMLYEAVTGIAGQDYALRRLGAVPRCPRELNPEVHPNVAELCLRLLHPTPIRRAGAADVATVVGDVLGSRRLSSNARCA